MFGIEIQGAFLQGPVLVCTLVAFGAGVGVLTGLFGVGGGFLTVPLLNVALGIPYPLAVGSDLSCIVGTSAAGAAKHWRLRHVAPKTMMIIAGGAVSGAVLGTRIQHWLQHTVCQGDARSLSLTMHPMFVCLLLLVSWLVYRPPRYDPDRGTLLQRLPLPPRVRLQLPGMPGVSLPGLVLIGLGAGILTGLMGIGGGVLMMPLLMIVVGLDTKQAIGTSLGVVLFSAASGTVRHGMEGHVTMWITLPLLLGSTLGVQLGAWLCQILHAARVRRYFALLVLAVTAAIIVDFVHKL